MRKRELEGEDERESYHVWRRAETRPLLFFPADCGCGRNSWMGVASDGFRGCNT
jgi:hypothetical protein